ncbi:hypothetical protein MJL48_30015, partial [Salmonella enterica subsp. enterica serovar Kentucky]|nr:hypothetical protein [Salmonella enterica subsp. enterica serovar Kentucky]
TENDILRYCRLSSGRNYATELERQLGITLERIDEKNPDGIGTCLEPFIPVSVVNPLMLENGWTFDDTFPAATGDTLYQHEFLYQ